jgi:hypothetical protein
MRKLLSELKLEEMLGCAIVTRMDNPLASGICAFHKVGHVIVERERHCLPLLKLWVSLV